MQIRELIITLILNKKNYKHVDYLPHARVSPILQMRIRLILRYFSILDLNFCDMYRISDWQCMYVLPRRTKSRHELPFPDPSLGLFAQFRP